MELRSYDILLKVDFAGASFEGKETIQLEGPVDNIELDAVDLTISSVTANAGKCKWSYNDKKRLSIVGTNFSTLEIEFSGKAVEGGLHGFYKSKYRGGYFLSTQFEPVGARNLFPCIDHPAKKAVFRISVTVPSGLTVISNTPVSSVKEYGEEKTVLFEETPRMSTYLLFIGIGEFVEQREPGGFDVIVASSPEQTGKGRFGVENGRLFLAEYERYYSLPYPLKKLHLIAIPEFAVGAMENWGAITFREVALLADETTTVSNRRLIALVIAHEIAHQWFGDLVTMKWWSDLWLNESFATYMSALIVDRIYPRWEVWPDFLTGETNGAMVGDSLQNTHPIEVSVGQPEEINQIFDEISYGKGASVLRMIASYIGEESFRKGVGEYLKRFSYGNAQSSDLWDSLEAASKQPVAAVMKRWIGTAGFPVLNASLDKGGIRIVQERFLLNGRDAERTWPVPVHYTLNGKEGRMLLEGREALLHSDNVSQVNLNHLRTGFYRVNYDKTLYHTVAQNAGSLDDKDKWGIISDLFYFLLSGRADLKQYLEFVKTFEEDTGYIVVSGIASQLELFRELLPDNRTIADAFQQFYTKQLSRIGIDRKSGESENSSVLREKLTEGLAMYDTQFASGLAGRYENISEQPAELRGSIGISYARSAGESAFEPLLSSMKSARSDADAMKALLALTSFREGGLVRRTLDLSFTGEVNTGHIAFLVYTAATNPEGKKEAWDWFKSNSGRLYKTYAGTGVNTAVTEFITARAGITCREEVEEFFSRNKIPEADRGVAKGLELLQAYSRLRDRYCS